MDLNERDYKILCKIVEKQNELVLLAKDFKIISPDDLSKIHFATRRGIIGFIGDLFELTKQLSDSTKNKLPFNQTVIKRFRDTASHQYGMVTDTMAHACLMHCVDKNNINAVKSLIEKYISE